MPSAPPGRVRSAASVLILTIWLVGGLYAGAAGWAVTKVRDKVSAPPSNASAPGGYYYYEGLSFLDRGSLDDFLQDRKMVSWFPWIFEVPEPLIPLLTAIAFGLLGGGILVLRKHALLGQPIGSLAVVSAPVFSSLIGVMLCFLALEPPAIFIKNVIQPESLAAVSLLGGTFSEIAFAFLERCARKLFGMKSEESASSGNPKEGTE